MKNTIVIIQSVQTGHFENEPSVLTGHFIKSNKFKQRGAVALPLLRPCAPSHHHAAPVTPPIAAVPVAADAPYVRSSYDQG